MPCLKQFLLLAGSLQCTNPLLPHFERRLGRQTLPAWVSVTYQRSPRTNHLPRSHGVWPCSPKTQTVLQHYPISTAFVHYPCPCNVAHNQCVQLPWFKESGQVAHKQNISLSSVFTDERVKTDYIHIMDLIPLRGFVAVLPVLTPYKASRIFIGVFT